MIKPQQKRSVMQLALSMAVGTFSSRILGFIRDRVMFQLFPTAVMDAFVVAFRLPNIFRRLLGEGSLSVSFIPVFVSARTDSEERAKHVANAVFTIVLSASIFISMACFVFMEPIIRYLVDDPTGFAATPGKVEQTIYLARIMIFYLILVSTYAFHTAIANTIGHFFLPAVGPTLFNVGLILFTILPIELGPYAGSSPSWGVIAGGVLQAGVVFWLLIKIGFLPRLTWNWSGPDVRHVFLNMVPGLFGLGVYQMMMLVNTKFAASLPEGTQSYIYLADRVLELPQSLIAVSLGAALLPRFSDLHSSGEKSKFLNEANQAVRLLLYLTLPAAVGMCLLARPLTEVLFMGGSFGPEDAAKTASVVEIYSGLMLFSSLSRVTAPAFFALKNTWLPAAIAFFVLVVHVLVTPYFVKHYGLTGLATATTASSILNIVVLQIFFYFWIGPLGYVSILFSALRLVPALLVMGAFCWHVYPMSEAIVGRNFALLFVVLVSVLIYFAITFFSRSNEAGKVMGLLRRRVGRSAS
jgi:putative peptidoglycan lipid II flippase